MVRVGLTGGLACGKSTVGKMMQARGAHLLQADILAHELMSPGQPVHDEVVRLFGPEIVHSDGTIDRPKLAEMAFGHGRVQELNAIVHPAVIARQAEWLASIDAREPQSIAVVEAALILEAAVEKRFDKIVVVTCKRDQKIDRYVQRTVSPDAGPLAVISARKEAQRRIAAQIPDEEKIKAADFVIDNSGSLQNTERQVEKLMRSLSDLARNSTAAETHS
jgi:dephospho-CoA kinase